MKWEPLKIKKQTNRENREISSKFFSQTNYPAFFGFIFRGLSRLFAVKN
jgi:hypothetical protein